MPDAALDATAEVLSRRLLAEVPADRPRGRADIDRLPAPLVPLLHARLTAAVDTAAPAPSAWIDAGAIDDATAAWRREALAAVRIPADVWPEAVREAVALALAHLVRPADTLAAYAFSSGAPALSVQEALDRARTFGPYPYLPQIAARYADRKELDLIDRVGLEQLFHRIDRRMVSTFGPDDWTTLLGPLVDLVGPVGSPPGAVPTALLRPLFVAKGVGTLALALEGIDSVAPGELRAILERTLVPAETPPSHPAEAPPTEAPPAETSPDVEEPAERPEAVPSPPPDATAESLDPPLPLPPVAGGSAPPTIGSKYVAPERGTPDDSEVLGPPVPVGTSVDGDEPLEAGPSARAPEAVPFAPLPAQVGAPGTAASAPPDLPSGSPEADGTGSQDAARLPDTDPMAEVRQAVADPLSEPLADLDPVETGLAEADPAEADSVGPGPAEETPVDDEPETARGSNPLIRPEATAPDEAPPPRTIADTFVVPDEEAEPASHTAPSVADAFVFPDDEPEPHPEAGPPDLGASLPTGVPAFDDEPLWKQLVRERRDDPPVAPAVESDADEEPLWKRFAKSDLAAKLPPPSEPTASPDLDGLEARVLGPEARDRRTWYVTELFDGSASDYHHTLARIDRSASYSDATDIISKDILRARSIDPYTESMVSFIDAVQDNFPRP